MSEPETHDEGASLATRFGALAADRLDMDALLAAWPVLSPQERVDAFRLLDREQAVEFFLARAARGQAMIILGLPPGERRLWMRLLAPDDAADVLQEADAEQRPALLDLLEPLTRREVSALLAYEEDDAGGLMSPRFVRVRPDMTVDEALAYLRRQMREHPETIHYVYVLDREQQLLGVISVRELFTATVGRLVRDVMVADVVSVPEDMDQEAVARVIASHDITAVPVLDAAGHMKGIVTVDDIVDVLHEEATEDIHKIGGTEALEAPYLQTGVLTMVRKRAGWLVLLLMGETLTASALGRYEAEIARAVVLALFVPVIISSGGNSGSQATTLVIRAMALGEVRLGHWWRIVRREFACGVLLGSILAVIGWMRIMLWQAAFDEYGEHAMLIAHTVAFSLLGIVVWGTLVGATMPLLLRRVGFDPASASAPMIATLVDVTGLMLYFTIARALLSGTLL
jgi:magnesium transporter